MKLQGQNHTPRENGERNRQSNAMKLGPWRGQLYHWWRKWQTVRYHRRLRRAIIRTAARFGTLYPEWQEMPFDLHFLLNQGMPIIQRHLSKTTRSAALDLALAWAEQLPDMSPGRRKAHVQAAASIAGEFLRLLTAELIQPELTTFQQMDPNTQRRWTGIPQSYLQAHK